MKNTVKTTAFICACALTFGTISLAAAPTYAIAPQKAVIAGSAAQKLSAPKAPETAMSRGTLTIEWKEDKAAAEYRIDVKRGDAKTFEEGGTVYSNFVNVTGLNNGEKITVRITPVDKNGNEGTPAVVEKTYKAEYMYIDSEGFFYVDSALMNSSFSSFRNKTGLDYSVERTDAYGDVIKYAAIPTDEGVEGMFAVLLDKDKKVKCVFTDIPADEFKGTLASDVSSHFGSGVDMTKEYPHEYDDYDVYYQWQIGKSLYFNVCDVEHERTDSDFIRQEYAAF